MGARVVAARDKGSFRRFNAGEGCCGIFHAANPGRVVLRSHDDKVVVHDVFAPHAVTIGHEGVFPLAGVYQQDVGVTVTP
jgi:hypothetical protein